MLVTADYYRNVTGELDKAAQIYREMIVAYPRDGPAYGSLGNAYSAEGDYQRAVEATRQNLQLTPDNVGPYSNLANFLLALQRPEEARKTVQQAQARKLEDYDQHSLLYAMAFLAGDSHAMAEQQQWFAANPAVEDFGLSLSADTEAYAGRLEKAGELTRRSVDLAIRTDRRETGAIWWENAALCEAAFSNFKQAQQAAEAGLKLYPDSQGVQVEAALAYAMIGDTRRAQVMADELDRRYPLDTQMQSLWLPAIHAQLALNRNSSKEAIGQLQRALPPLEYGLIPFFDQISCLYPTYIRGQAYLTAGQGKEAVAEFQKILDHSNGAEADLPRTRALAAYKDFLTLWKDADPDIPIYKEAKAEYAKLQ